MKRLVITVGLVLAAALTWAGSLDVHDEDGLLTSRSAIESAANQAGYSVRVMVSSKRGHGATFNSYVAQAVASPNMAVIGVDPQGRHTEISTGSGLGIRGSLLGAIAITANPEFKAGRWDAGIARIIVGLEAERTTVSAQAAPSFVIKTAAPSTDWWFWGWMGLGLIIVIGGFSWVLIRQAKQRKEAREEAEARAEKIGRMVQAADPVAYDKDAVYSTQSAAQSGSVYSTYAMPPAPVYVDRRPIVVDRSLRSPDLMDYVIMDNMLNHQHQQNTVIVNNPAPVYQAPDPAPSYSGGSDWSSSSSSSNDDSSSSFSGGSDFSSSSFDSGSSSGGSDW